MAPMAVNIQAATPPIEHCRLLPESRRDWSFGAQSTYRGILDELDAWCRRYDAPRGLNSWIAEEAVRRSQPIRLEVTSFTRRHGSPDRS